jgi:hypothetical protein
MTKRELETKAKTFVVLGVATASMGTLNWFRTPPENIWRVPCTVGAAITVLMQFLLAHELHKKAEGMREYHVQ